jgi:hypothetical protein
MKQTDKGADSERKIPFLKSYRFPGRPDRPPAHRLRVSEVRKTHRNVRKASWAEKPLGTLERS